MSHSFSGCETLTSLHVMQRHSGVPVPTQCAPCAPMTCQVSLRLFAKPFARPSCTQLTLALHEPYATWCGRAGGECAQCPRAWLATFL